MSASWRDKLHKNTKADVQTMAGGNRDNEDLKTTSDYIPMLETVKLPEEQYPQGFFDIRLLPRLQDSPHSHFIFTVSEFDVAKHKIGLDYGTIHLPETLDPSFEKKNPIRVFQRDLYFDGSEHAKKFANTLWPKERHYANAIMRKVQLIDPQGKKDWHTNVGPRKFRMPDFVKEKVLMAFDNPDVGDVSDPFDGFDILYHMERIEVRDEQTGKTRKYPQYDKSDIRRRNSRAGSDEELDRWMNSLHDLTQEYKPIQDIAILDEIASRLKDKYHGRLGQTVVQGADLEPSEPDNGNETRTAERAREAAATTTASSTVEDDLEEVQQKSPPAETRATPAQLDDDDDLPPVTTRQQPAATLEDDDDLSVRESAQARTIVDDDDDDDNWLDHKIAGRNKA